MTVDVINPAIDYGYVFYRHCNTETGAPSKWIAIDAMRGTSYYEFMDYMTMMCYGESAYLRRVKLFSGLEVLEDQFNFQYYGVEMIPEGLT